MVFRAAATGPVAAEVVAQLDAALELADPQGSLLYADPARGIAKRALVDAGALVGVRLCGDVAASQRLAQMVADAAAVISSAAVLGPAGVTGGRPDVVRRIVCNCVGVSEQSIRDRARTTGDVAALRGELGCGSGCGSCIPEVERLVRSVRASMEAA